MKIPAPTDFRHYHHLIGAYNWHSDDVSALAVAVKNSQAFIAFLEYLLVDCYPTQRLLLVMDNAGYHHSAPVKAALSLFEHRVRVIYLPARCPDLNPIERYWRHLKDLACANKAPGPRRCAAGSSPRIPRAAAASAWQRLSVRYSPLKINPVTRCVSSFLKTYRESLYALLLTKISGEIGLASPISLVNATIFTSDGELAAGCARRKLL